MVNRTHLRTERAKTPHAQTTLSPRTSYTSAAAVTTKGDGQQADGAVGPSAAAAVTVPRGETAANEVRGVTCCCVVVPVGGSAAHSELDSWVFLRFVKRRDDTYNLTARSACVCSSSLGAFSRGRVCPLRGFD